MAYRRYQKALKPAGAVDFDDLLLCTEELFASSPEARAAEAARFSHLLIDEYQDTNGAQYRIVKALADEHRNLCVVGDDDQSIYGWRGAEVTHILRFQRDWPDAKVVRLEENYRSTGAILTMANRLIAYNKHAARQSAAGRSAPAANSRGSCSIPTKTTEANAGDRGDQFADRSAGMAEPRDFAILFRTNEQPRAFEQELRRAKLPYTLIGGMSFYDRKEVRDVLAYLQACWPIRATKSRCCGSSTRRPAASAPRRSNCCWSGPCRRPSRCGRFCPRRPKLRGLPAPAVEAVGKFRELIERLSRTVEARAVWSDVVCRPDPHDPLPGRDQSAIQGAERPDRPAGTRSKKSSTRWPATSSEPTTPTLAGLSRRRGPGRPRRAATTRNRSWPATPSC